jgi:hypothetical protein
LAGTFLALWLCGSSAARAQDKEIRLRNEHIRTTPPRRDRVEAARQAERRPDSGLVLIQFVGRFNAAWREELRPYGVELLRYVPDDAFVARLTGGVMEDIQALPFVQWAGKYRPEHKLHAALRGLVAVPNPLDGPRISILMAPGATPAELAAAKTGLASVEQQSNYRFGTVYRGRLAPGQLTKLAESPAVLWIEAAPEIKLNDETSSKIVGGAGVNHATLNQELGFDGRGRPVEPPLPPIRVAVADTGLSTGMAGGEHPDLAGRVAGYFHYGGLGNAADEHLHGTHVAGIIAGNGFLGTADETGAHYGLGLAPMATIVAQRIFDRGGKFAPPPSFEVLTHDAVRAGADIGNNSWGADTQGRYDVTAAEFDALVRDADLDAAGDQPYVLVFSGGNAGPAPQTMASPAVAKNVIAVGASQSSRSNYLSHMGGVETVAGFSSRGPSEDGRIKPDLVAPGTWIASLRSVVGNNSNSWLAIDNDYHYMGGSSQAGAHVSGAAAAFIQYYRERYASNPPFPSPAMVKAALIHASVDMDDAHGTDPVPNSAEGWGRLDLTQIIGSQRAPEFEDQTTPLAGGQVAERRIIVASGNTPLRVTMTYTDVPGFPAAIPALVNDLDLEVTGPDGRVYRGNQFADGASVADAPSADRLNNVECIYLPSSLPGEYVIRIIAFNVVADAIQNTPAVDQDFALAIGGDIATSETGAVLLDRGSYTAPGTIRIRLFDLDLKGLNSATVSVHSATEPEGLELSLAPENNGGMFTGMVATALGPALPDASLQIAHDDYIRVEFHPEGPGGEQIFATAIADLVPPAITSISATNQFGRMVVSWTTDEPAASFVRFGTNSILNRAVSNVVLSTTHQLALPDLVNGLAYSFSVISTDAAGNAITNGPAGPAFSFVAQSPATVLLVDDYIPPDPDETCIPVSTYTGPLNQLGISYEIWSRNSHGRLPDYQDLQPYPIVMWRVNDSLFRDTNSIPPAQQIALEQYLANGGAFFMASMEILSRLLDEGSTDFVTNVLHVRRFQRNATRFEPCSSCDEDAQVPAALGAANDVIGSGLQLTNLDYSDYFDPFFLFDSDFADTFGAATNATPFLVESISREACGVRFPRTGEDSPGRMVFVSFPLDVIPEIGPSPNNRAAFLRRALQFLSPGLNGVGSIAFSRSSHKLPDLIAFELADSDLSGLDAATIQVSSSTAPTPFDVTLAATTQPGVFRGFLPLVSATNPPAPGHLQAADGDTLFANYFDESAQSIVQATAEVDATPSGISDLRVVAHFQSATISWNTSEATDALVQYGESAFLGRTAYLAEFKDNHQVQITGLFPGRTYLFKLVSRDAAGNTAVSDNDGKFFSFQTRAPLSPPFIDPLNGTNQVNWSVYNGDGTQTQWQLGQVNNAHVTRGNAWASNPLGGEARSIDTVLISPAIQLAGGNVAALEFSHAYKFEWLLGSDLINHGQLFIVTNSVSAPVLLAEYSGASATGETWPREHIDLTPYLGQVILLAWRHRLESIQMDRRPGWALDDFSITVSNVPPVTIGLTNNLAQATMTLSGPTTRTGRGYATNFVGLPPGRYVATWADVPYYRTPPRQTNTLASGASFLFEAEYTFPDVNANGMSDLWEMAFFRELSPTRTCLTDTDGDGFHDCAEFAAGTNPTNANSLLRLSLPAVIELPSGNKLRFEWPSIPGLIYQLQALRRADFQTWDPQSSWLRATNDTLFRTISVPDPFEPYLFRLEVRP